MYQLWKITVRCNTFFVLFFKPQPVVWRENQLPGTITQLKAKDIDGPENGAPFLFSISSDASYEIKTKFDIIGLLSYTYPFCNFSNVL